ncbi:MAG: PcfJ domain-containing protein [Oscillospiraceae bacterium]|nr:PcfJ domain-containing protein [Oscillospiraceae bacterium]
MEQEIYLTATLTDAVPAARFAWYHAASDEKEPVYYPLDPENPELELLDNEDDISYEEITVLACPFCHRVFHQSEITNLPDSIEEALSPYYGDAWKEIALLHDVPFEYISRCPACGKAWHICPENLRPVDSGSAIFQSFRTERRDTDVLVHIGAVIPTLSVDALQIQTQTYQICFHTASGESIEMTPTGQKSITFNAPWQILEETFQEPARMQEAAAALADVIGCQVPQLRTLQQLCIWNRFRWADAETIDRLKAIPDVASYFTDIAPDETRESVMQKLLAGLGIHDCKTTRRALTQDITCIQDAKVFAALGFTSMDCFRKMLETRQLRCYATLPLNTPAISRFMHDLIARKGEMAALRSVMASQDSYMLRDTANYYASGLEQLPEEDCLHMLHGTIAEIHDRLLEHVRINERPNEAIQYSTGQKKYLQHDINGISFRLAADTDELYEVGGRMYNCVASYCDAALLGQSLIVIGRDKTGAPVLCIELSPYFSLVQLRAIRNTIPQEPLRSAALEWIERSGVHATGCEDYRAMCNA